MGLEFQAYKAHLEHHRHPPKTLGETHTLACPWVIPGGDEWGSPGWPAQGLTGLGERGVEKQLLFGQQGQGGCCAPTGQLQAASQQ